MTEDQNTSYVSDYRLSLLRQVEVNGKPAAELLASRVLTDLYPGALILEGDTLLLNGRPGVNTFWGGGGVGIGGAAPPGRAGPGVAVGTAALAETPGWETTSDRLMIFDLSQGKLDPVYDEPTRMYNMQLMGTHEGKLFINLAGNGGGYYYDPYGAAGRRGRHPGGRRHQPRAHRRA